MMDERASYACGYCKTNFLYGWDSVAAAEHARRSHVERCGFARVGKERRGRWRSFRLGPPPQNRRT